MRKLTIVILSFLLAFSGVAAAEGIDLTTMTLDELVALHQSVDAEIDARISCDPEMIPAGVYVVGESIKAGKYNILTNDDYYGFNVATFASKEIYEKAFAENNEALASFQCYVGSDDSAFVQLDDGMVLLVSGTALIEEAKASWMP